MDTTEHGPTNAAISEYEHPLAFSKVELVTASGDSIPYAMLKADTENTSQYTIYSEKFQSVPLSEIPIEIGKKNPSPNRVMWKLCPSDSSSLHHNNALLYHAPSRPSSPQPTKRHTSPSNHSFVSFSSIFFTAGRVPRRAGILRTSEKSSPSSWPNMQAISVR